MNLPMLRLNLKFWLPKFIFVSVFPLPFMQVYLQCDYSNQGTWEKIIESQHFLETKDSQVSFANGPIKFKVQQCNHRKL